MAQKVNPIIFRRLVNFEDSRFQQQIYNTCYSPYIINEEEQISQYLIKFLSYFKLKLHSFKYSKSFKGAIILSIRYVPLSSYKEIPLFKMNQQSLNFSSFEYAFLYGLSKILRTKKINVSLFNLLKLNNSETPVLPSFFRASKIFSTQEITNVLRVLSYNKGSASTLATLISFKLQRMRSKLNKKSQGRLLILIKALLNHIQSQGFIKGIKVVIKGRINGIPRSRKWEVSEGFLSLQRIDNNIDYHYAPSYTIYGTFGVKVWINYGN